MKYFLHENLRIWFYGLISFSLAFTILGIATYYYFASSLQSKDGIMNNNNTGVVLTDRNGKTFFTFYKARDIQYVSINKISDNLKKSVIAVEDKDFYKHNGISFKGIARSLLVDLATKSLESGGSTITQQLVKNSFLSSSKSLLRKFQET